MNKLKTIFRVFIFIFIYIGIQYVLRFALSDDHNVISRVMLHDLYEENDIEILFCGASHCQLGVDPEIISDITGMNCFNCSSSAQGLETSYALIKEAEKRNPLKKVYVNVDYSIVTRTKPNLESIYIVSDYMKPSINKYSFLINATDFSYYVNSFAPLHKGRGYLKNFSLIRDNIKYKMTPDYYDYLYVDSSYMGKGHISSRSVIEEGSLWHKGDISIDSFELPERQEKYLNQIISFCDSRNIELTFIGIPVTDFYLERLPNYDDYINIMEDFFVSKNVNYQDFNKIREDILDLNENCNFNDDEHLNYIGSDKYSKVLGLYISNEMEKGSFYDSYKDKLIAKDFTISGVLVIDKNDYDSSYFKHVLDNNKLTGVPILFKEYDGNIFIPLANRNPNYEKIDIVFNNDNDKNVVSVTVDGEVTNEFVFD